MSFFFSTINGFFLHVFNGLSLVREVNLEINNYNEKKIIDDAVKHVTSNSTAEIGTLINETDLNLESYGEKKTRF